MLGFFGGLTNSLTVVIGVGFLIFVHELGHFVLAKLSKVRVEAFSLGFGPALWKTVRGDTEYRISVVPLGGYVKMAGENPGEQSGAGDELHSKPALNRFLIFAAGSFMNLLVAFPLCITAYIVGINELDPTIAAIEPDSAEWHSSLQVGDIIREVNGKTVRSLNDYHMEMALTDAGVTLPVTVERGGREVKTSVTTEGPNGYGIGAMIVPVVQEVMSDSAAEKGNLRVGDRFLAVDGVEVDAWEPVKQRIENSPGRPMEFRVRRPATGEGTSPETLTLKLTPTNQTRGQLEVEKLLLPAVDTKFENPAFHFGTIPARGDRVTAVTPVGAPGERKEIANWADLKHAIEGFAGREVELTVARKDQPAPVIIQAQVHQTMDGRGLLGMAPAEGKRVAFVPAGSPFADAGLQVGDVLISVNGEEVAGWLYVGRIAAVGKGEALDVQVKRGDQKVAIKLTPSPVTVGVLGVLPKVATVLHRYEFGKAVSVSVEKVREMVVDTLQTLRLLVLGHLSPKGLAGPVGIFTMSYKVAEQELSRFIKFLAFISVNLAVVNMMPIPVLDGGHILFLFVEKLRGRPVSENVLYRAQIVGLVLLLSLVLWVTFFDILRTIGG